jgi:spore coat polysaccharide biosynthesis protein SpsF (cytidylyltransferase family)
MNIVAIVQARMGSSRLPGKIIRELGDRPVFLWVYDRLQRSNLIDKVLFATTEQKKDDVFCEILEKNQINFIRGSEQDVLGRYYLAATKSSADIIVRVTCDCPFIDPELIDEGLRMHGYNDINYTSNVVPPTFPDGFDFEIFSREILDNAHLNAKSDYEREHVTPWIIEHTVEAQNTIKINDNISHVNKRVTLDNEDDFLLLKILVEKYGVNIDTGLQDIIYILDRYPELIQINQIHDVRKK